MAQKGSYSVTSRTGLILAYHCKKVTITSIRNVFKLLKLPSAQPIPVSMQKFTVDEISSFLTFFVDWAWHGEESKAEYAVRATIDPSLWGPYPVNNMFDSNPGSFWHGQKNHGSELDDWLR